MNAESRVDHRVFGAQLFADQSKGFGESSIDRPLREQRT